MGLRESIEEGISEGLFSEKKDKSLTDSILSKEETLKIRNILTKKELTQKDLLLLLDTAVGTEVKLHYLDKRERYVLGKYESVWLAKIVRKAQEVLYIKKKKEIYNKMTNHQKELFEDCLNLTLKYAIWSYEVYNFWARSGFSVGGKGFLEILQQKFDITYNDKMKKIGDNNE